jgi:DNA polymerase-3 subunit epsilon
MRDRIVELSAVTLMPSGEQRVKTWRVNPQMPIPPTATAVHGISDADVKACPTFSALAPTLVSVFSGCDLGGYNARTFDVPMLEVEFDRVGVKPSPVADACIVDAKEIFHGKEPRDLAAAMRFYCNEPLVGAHGAEADALATAKILLAQLARYSDLPRDVDALERAFLKAERFVDPTRRLRMDEQGRVVVNFGQHKGTLLNDLAMKKRDYLEWMLDGEWHPRVKEAIRNALEVIRS